MPRFGKYQRYTSDDFQRLGKLGVLYHKVVGLTFAGRYNQGRWFSRILKRHHLRPRRILDAGCGYGIYSFWLSETFSESSIDGVDLSQDDIRNCKRVQQITGRFPNVNFAMGDLTQLQAENQYDLVLCADVLEHLPAPKEVLARFHRALVDGGYLYLRIPTRNQHRIFNEKHFGQYDAWAEKEHISQIYDLASLSQEVQDAGFVIRFASFTNGWLAQLGFELGIIFEQRSRALFALAVPFLKLLYFFDALHMRRKTGNGCVILTQKQVST